MTKYFPASEISNKAYEILKGANEISNEKAYNILVFVGFKPLASITKYFPAYEISKQKALKHFGFYGIQTHDLYDKKYSPP